MYANIIFNRLIQAIISILIYKVARSIINSVEKPLKNFSKSDEFIRIYKCLECNKLINGHDYERSDYELDGTCPKCGTVTILKVTKIGKDFYNKIVKNCGKKC